MTSIVFFAKRILNFNASTPKAQNMINKILTLGAKIYIYIRVQVNSESYNNIEICCMCNLLSRNDFKEAWD